MAPKKKVDASQDGLASRRKNGRPTKLAAELPDIGCWASELREGRVEWLCQPWIPRGALTVVTGQPNAGKSTFGAYLMGMAARSVVLPGAEEQFEINALPRLKANRADPRNVLLLRDTAYTFPAHKERVARAVEKVGAQLVWIDPLDNYLGDVSENDGQEVRAFLESLAWIGHQTGAAVVGVRHPGKLVANLLPGSRCWRAVPRMVLRLLYEPGPPEKRVCEPYKNSMGGDARPRYYDLIGEEGKAKAFVWLDGADVASVDSMLNVTDKIERWKVDQAEELLGHLLAEGEMESTEVYKAGDAERIDSRLMRRAAERIGVVIRREGFGKGHRSYWSLPGPTLATPDI